jgi:hypothetical protein
MTLSDAEYSMLGATLRQAELKNQWPAKYLDYAGQSLIFRVGQLVSPTPKLVYQYGRYR